MTAWLPRNASLAQKRFYRNVALGTKEQMYKVIREDFFGLTLRSSFGWKNESAQIEKKRLLSKASRNFVGTIFR